VARATRVSGFFFLAGSILATNLARNTDPGARLKLVDWTHIHEAYERHRHTAFPHDEGFDARNREQQFTARFNGRGLEIRPDSGNWRFTLE
jgi:hypothetical protein